MEVCVESVQSAINAELGGEMNKLSRNLHQQTYFLFANRLVAF